MTGRSPRIAARIAIVTEAMRHMDLPCTPAQVYDEVQRRIGDWRAIAVTIGNCEVVVSHISYQQVVRFLSQFPEFTKVAPAQYRLSENVR